MELASKAFEFADIDDFTEVAYAKGWTDGLPVLPPTEKKVTAMLDYIRRDPREVLGVVPPGEGLATIEKVAINAVMAGCLPEYLPVVITAVEAMLDPTFELMRVQCTT
ncbi:MAG TPA: UGSC family (seleno)protein, partial [Burkholderiales bacterium]|nr:UGSC family (seleno)protein [Burkholderiales bacterium]